MWLSIDCYSVYFVILHILLVLLWLLLTVIYDIYYVIITIIILIIVIYIYMSQTIHKKHRLYDYVKCYYVLFAYLIPKKKTRQKRAVFWIGGWLFYGMPMEFILIIRKTLGFFAGHDGHVHVMDVGQNGRPMWDHRCECLV